MQIKYDREPEDSCVECPWFAFQEFHNGKGRRGYLAIADTEVELLAYIRATYPDASVSRYTPES